ncbi:unnamed protein product [Parascedosporium putredinis]|nr:unnamed protein product [Parascedosporium putredinis]CAI7999604.1 unnamed protein product [Parascedosporium putredinis]
MKLSVACLQLLAWAASTNALFIWEPCRVDGTCDDDGEATKRSTLNLGAEVKRSPVTVNIHRVAERKVDDLTNADILREARWLSRKYAHRRAARSHAQGHSKRENQYSVMEPTPPEQSNGIGIYQDGKDYAYFVRVQVGSSNTPMYMLFDTGAGTTWVMGSKCSSDPCALHDSFDISKSTTAKDLKSNFSVNYGSGSVKGPTIEDSIKLGDFGVSMKFGVAETTSNDFKHFPFDGILGMSMTETSTDNFGVKLKESKKLAKNVFSVSLNRGSSGVNDGELTLGGINQKKYTGDISYTNIPKDVSSDWAIPLDDISVGTEGVGIRDRLGYIDTGTSFVFGPPKDVESVHGLIKGATSSDGITWKVPCDTKQAISMTFSGKRYDVQAVDWVGSSSGDGMCGSNIYGHEVVSNGWLLGAVFLKNVYTVFDMDELKIGFAAREPTEAAAEQPSSSPPADEATTPASTEPTSETEGPWALEAPKLRALESPPARKTQPPQQSRSRLMRSRARVD